MSEVQKPVEEPVVAPTSTEAPAAAVEPTTETTTETPAAEPATESAPATTEPATEAAAAEEPAKEEVKPVEEGVLGYKGPGLLKSFIFQKKFFWFGTEPVEQKSLSSYLRGEKPEFANHNAAWAAHTGKGLLFFSKKQAEKTPAGIINLSEAKDLTEDGTVDFHFTIGGHKHTFQATTLADRDNWVAQLKAKIAEAVEAAPAVKESEAYKSTHSSLSKPVIAVVPPKKEEKAEAKEEKKEEKPEDKAEAKEDKAEKKEEKKEEKADKKEEKSARKSRSASRKRTSIFGNIFPKKEEEKKEAAKEEAAPAEATPTATEPAAEGAAAAPAEASTETPAAEAATETKPEEKPKTVKRSSIFGNLSFNKKDKKPESDAPVVPAKDEPATTEPITENAPVIPAVESTEPLAAGTASPAAAATESAPVTNGADVETPPANKRKSSLPFGFGTKKEKVTSEDESEKPKSPFAKLRQTVRGKKEEKKEEKAESKEDKTEETPAASNEPEVVSEPTPAATSTPQVAATA